MQFSSCSLQMVFINILYSLSSRTNFVVWRKKIIPNERSKEMFRIPKKYDRTMKTIKKFGIKKKSSWKIFYLSSTEGVYGNAGHALIKLDLQCEFFHQVMEQMIKIDISETLRTPPLLVYYFFCICHRFNLQSFGRRKNSKFHQNRNKLLIEPKKKFLMTRCTSGLHSYLYSLDNRVLFWRNFHEIAVKLYQNEISQLFSSIFLCCKT